MFNSRSIVKQLSKFQSFAYTSPHKIFAITETWLTDCVYDNEILPSGFNIHRKDRSSRGGGVLVALNNSIGSVVIPSPPDLELIAVKITFHHPLILCVVYVPPSPTDDYRSSLLLHLDNLYSTNDSVIVVGDFNCPDLNWNTLTGSSHFSCTLCDLAFEHNLSQLAIL